MKAVKIISIVAISAAVCWGLWTHYFHFEYRYDKDDFIAGFGVKRDLPEDIGEKVFTFFIPFSSNDREAMRSDFLKSLVPLKHLYFNYYVNTYFNSGEIDFMYEIIGLGYAISAREYAEQSKDSRFVEAYKNYSDPLDDFSDDDFARINIGGKPLSRKSYNEIIRPEYQKLLRRAGSNAEFLEVFDNLKRIQSLKLVGASFDDLGKYIRMSNPDVSIPASLFYIDKAVREKKYAELFSKDVFVRTYRNILTLYLLHIAPENLRKELYEFYNKTKTYTASEYEIWYCNYLFGDFGVDDLLNYQGSELDKNLISKFAKLIGPHKVSELKAEPFKDFLPDFKGLIEEPIRDFVGISEKHKQLIPIFEKYVSDYDLKALMPKSK